MATTAETVPPPISWAQKNDLLHITVDVECKDIQTNVTENSFTFKGTNALDANIKYEATLNFLNPIDPERVTSKNIGRCIEYTIYKKESGPFWKSLTNDKLKLHFLRANFLKWESEFDDEEKNARKTGTKEMLQDLMFMNGGETPGEYFNFDGDDDDSDDNIPSLSRSDDEDDTDDKQKEKQTK